MDSEEYQHATALARAVRAKVAGQLRDLLVEADRMGSRGDVAARITALVEVELQLRQAQGRQMQARELGLPLAPSVQAEREALTLLRSSAMSLAAACGGWAAAIDYAHEAAQDPTLNGTLAP